MWKRCAGFVLFCLFLFWSHFSRMGRVPGRKGSESRSGHSGSPLWSDQIPSICLVLTRCGWASCKGHLSLIQDWCVMLAILLLWARRLLEVAQLVYARGVGKFSSPRPNFTPTYQALNTIRHVLFTNKKWESVSLVYLWVTKLVPCCLGHFYAPEIWSQMWFLQPYSFPVDSFGYEA